MQLSGILRHLCSSIWDAIYQLIQKMDSKWNRPACLGGCLPSVNTSGLNLQCYQYRLDYVAFKHSSRIFCKINFSCNTENILLFSVSF